ncbi:PLC-like phosphodiesterase [Athelia psychrophila]|uniref:PLC-like phosphodiesterase n=1 Tax=Athelia psychrophila TaxID=1759441 RepID=A0A166CFG1_9AGAM|nr:PLC-like phosphodiesterase [Fibularhizoctonia sp. CBS 109695]
MRAYSLAASLSAFASLVVGAIVPEKRATVCNGHAEFCDRSYGNITYVGAHDSFTYTNNTLNLASDQRVDIPTQLDFGVRLLQAQAHDNFGVLHFCHTSCILFDGGPVETYLATVKTWLDANPNEVLTFIFTNPDALSLPDQWEPAFTASGLADMAYVPPHLPMAQTDWPTLGALIDAGTRLVVFLDAGADGSDGGVVDFIMPEFDMVWETPYSVTNASFPCSVDRISGSLTAAQHMYMINHSLNVNEFGTGIIVSDPGAAATTNGVPSIIAHADGCAPLAGGRYPNFVLLDFVNIGDAFTAADQLNGV